MPKIRDLGINVIPETMRPPEIGGGGGGKGGGQGGDCEGATMQCPAGTLQNTLSGGCYDTAQTTCPAGTRVQTANTCYDFAAQCTAGTRNQSNDTCYGYAAQCTAGTIQTTAGTCYDFDAQCPPGTRNPTPFVVHMTAAQTGQAAAAGLTREAIALLRQQLHQQIAQLDELAKSIGPTTAEEIDAREQQLKAELEELANRRNRLTTTEE